MLAENRHVVEALRDALLERHELIGDEILDVIHGAVADPAAPAPAMEPGATR
jgi:hypothetical protein